MNIEEAIKKRLDQWLVELDLAPSKTKAKDLVLAGSVLINGKAQVKPGAMFTLEQAKTLKITSTELLKYVSRGGLKLEGALKKLQLGVQGLKVLDIGSSTGGFCDCLLQAGADLVVGFDVGHGQLSSQLVINSQLINFEGVHFEKAEEHPQLGSYLQEKFKLIVADVSFVSIEKFLHWALRWLLPDGKLLFLVKPQFELSAKDLNKKGIVKEESSYIKVEEKIKSLAIEHQLSVHSYFRSELLGKDGNREYFVFLTREK